MATRTTNLNLQLPGKGEFRDSWNTPVNENFTAIDQWAGETELEISEARFTKASLKEFLEVAHDESGELLPTPEVISDRNSYLYGNKTGTTYYELKDLSLLRDKEVWAARSGQTSLQNGIAFPRSFSVNKILTGYKDSNGYPLWAGHTANKVQIDGRPTPIWLEIAGKISRIRSLKEVTISGGAATYYVYAEFSPTGSVNYSDTGADCGQEAFTGDIRIHEHSSVQYTLLDVQAGDVLTYSSPAIVAGSYLVEEVAPDGVVSRLKIVGVFPTEGSSISYTVSDPLGVTLGFSATEEAVAGRVYLAEADFDGAGVTAVRARNFGDTFVGEWRPVDVSSVATFEEIWNHRLGSDKLEVKIQVSQANDGTSPTEELALTTMSASLTGLVGGSLGGTITAALTGTVSNGTLGLTPAPPTGDQSLTGTISNGDLDVDVTDGKTFTPSNGTLAVSAVPNNSAIMKYDKNRIWVKNAVPSYFYKDYDGTVRQTGFVRVIISKKG